MFINHDFVHFVYIILFVKYSFKSGKKFLKKGSFNRTMIYYLLFIILKLIQEKCASSNTQLQ